MVDSDATTPAPSGKRTEGQRADGVSLTTLSLGVLNAVLTVSYPIAVWWCLANTSARRTSLWLMLLVIPLVALRLRGTPREARMAVLRVPLVILGVLLLGALTKDPRFVLSMPVLINLGLLVTFGVTLRAGGVPMVERFARLSDPDLDAPRIAHCRQWTVRWCLFFVVNAGASAMLALGDDVRLWAIYTSGIAYALMGLMFAAEFLQRRYRFREYSSRFYDRALRALWSVPPSPIETRSETHD